MDCSMTWPKSILMLSEGRLKFLKDVSCEIVIKRQ